MPIVHEHRSAFDDRNLFLQVLMGLTAYAAQYQALLLRCGPAHGATTTRDDDPFLDACLGLAHFASHVLDRLATAAVPTDAHETAPPSDAPPRRLLD